MHHWQWLEGWQWLVKRHRRRRRHLKPLATQMRSEPKQANRSLKE
jgi:hypothetical protein